MDAVEADNISSIKEHRMALEAVLLTGSGLVVQSVLVRRKSGWPGMLQIKGSFHQLPSFLEGASLFQILSIYLTDISINPKEL